jgi:predicted nucleic acid-binding Zn ribbon protein
MPTYIYKCDDTGEEFEYLQSINSKPLEFWPQDVKGYDPNKPKKVHRKIGTGIGVVLKGTGFYETDYVRKSSSSESNS